MRYRGLISALIGTSALCMTGCGTSRTATAKSSELSIERFESVDSSRVENLVVLDTLKEITTITVDRNDRGDTLRLTQITDRTRATARDRVKDTEVKVVKQTDTVFIVRRDSVQVSEVQGSSRASPFVNCLKWVFWIIVALIVLMKAGDG